MSKWMDVNMLVIAGGRERTAAEFRELYNQAGFELEQIVPTPSPLSIVIGNSRTYHFAVYDYFKWIELFC